MKIWKMHLKDNRGEGRCKDTELKFRICAEKSLLGIGWGLNAALDSWENYRELADLYYREDTGSGYTAAARALDEMSCGDLVWTQNPVTYERWLAQVVDDKPSLCCHLREFDLFSYRKAEFYKVKVDEEQLKNMGLLGEKLSGRHTIEQIHEQCLIDATFSLWDFVRTADRKNKLL